MIYLSSCKRLLSGSSIVEFSAFWVKIDSFVKRFGIFTSWKLDSCLRYWMADFWKLGSKMLSKRSRESTIFDREWRTARNLSRLELFEAPNCSLKRNIRSPRARKKGNFDNKSLFITIIKTFKPVTIYLDNFSSPLRKMASLCEGYLTVAALKTIMVCSTFVYSSPKIQFTNSLFEMWFRKIL